MTEWTDPRYAELVQHLRQEQDKVDARTNEGEQPKAVRGFIYQLPVGG